jgi:hypothetical protein
MAEKMALLTARTMAHWSVGWALKRVGCSAVPTARMKADWMVASKGALKAGQRAYTKVVH